MERDSRTDTNEDAWWTGWDSSSQTAWWCWTVHFLDTSPTLSITSISDIKLMLHVRTSASTHVAISPYSDVHVSLDMNFSNLQTKLFTNTHCRAIIMHIYFCTHLQFNYKTQKWKSLLHFCKKKKFRSRGTHLIRSPSRDATYSVLLLAAASKAFQAYKIQQRSIEQHGR